ncbi:hypothetical protein BDY17DRAFT_298925 [Neohortaea acidophila]|uniref:Uncharacterized protein n=1 Tax=Neohortaea acidophila TaxID=245834 RepID=A0A6A6PSK1_9PEZI|nr:uncharacterized protein BDY17DRAFT_298925 [Neohortaea acidophila]KAF2482661.1 hypothetical protein BDY17DRAFT_298925 [Neohortaea acidophila]
MGPTACMATGPMVLGLSECSAPGDNSSPATSCRPRPSSTVTMTTGSERTERFVAAVTAL